MDAVAPGLLLAQAIGRWGNWWNQELYGKPTDLPWGLEIDPTTGRADLRRGPTFHPTFLYEFIYDSLGAVVVILVGWRFRIRPPALFALYVAIYTFGRFFEELLRVDPAPRDRAAAAQRLGVDRRLPVLERVLRVVAVPASEEGASPAAAEVPDDGDSTRPRPALPLASRAMVVRELELDLDAFEGPFDLLLTLVLKQELEPAEVDVAGIVLAFLERLAERDELDLDACGEFLVLVAALLELKARGLFTVEDGELDDLDAEEAAEELAQRLAEYRRIEAAAGWLAERLEEEGGRYFRLGPAPLAPRPPRQLAPQDPALLADVLRRLAADPPSVSLSQWRCASRRSPSSSAASARCSRGEAASTSTRRRATSRAPRRPWRSSRCWSCARRGRSRFRRRPRSRRSAWRAPSRAEASGGRTVDRPLRLITATPVDRLARTIEALLVIASQPLSLEELAAATEDGAERIETALGLLARALQRGPQRDRAREGRGRLCVPRVARLGRSVRTAVRAAGRARALRRALETLAIVAYLGPCTRPDIARHPRRRRRSASSRGCSSAADRRGRPRRRAAGRSGTASRRSSSGSSGSRISRRCRGWTTWPSGPEDLRGRLELVASQRSA